MGRNLLGNSMVKNSEQNTKRGYNGNCKEYTKHVKTRRKWAMPPNQIQNVRLTFSRSAPHEN